METFAKFYLATVLAAFTLAPTVGQTCPAHAGKEAKTTTKVSGKIASADKKVPASASATAQSGPKKQ